MTTHNKLLKHFKYLSETNYNNKQKQKKGFRKLKLRYR